MNLIHKLDAGPLRRSSAREPAGLRSRRDLTGMHRVMGSHAIVERAWPALSGLHLVDALDVEAATGEDAALSVRAGFRERELSALGPAPAASWQSREHAAGLFGHGFGTSRAETRAWAQ